MARIADPEITSIFDPQFITTVGFPIFACVCVSWVLFVLGRRLADAHINHATELAKTLREHAEQARELLQEAIVLINKISVNQEMIARQMESLFHASSVLSQALDTQPHLRGEDKQRR